MVYPIPKTHLLIAFHSLAVHEIETEVAISTITNRRRAPSMRDEFLKLYPKKSMEGYFIILASVTEVVEDFKWWYMACSCMKVVSYVDGVPFCKDCQKNVYDMTPRQMLDDIEGQPAGFFPEEILNLLKFAPALTKLPECNATGEGLELSTCCKSTVTELDITPPSCVASSSNVEETGSSGKKDTEEHEEAPLEREKRVRVRAVKLEKN
ncbi:Nucleic acid-binding, OB-fold [Sesbania bispinosa]|nr:Nucleic acid-binding, OB-fold [Sesbania bispinosa]